MLIVTSTMLQEIYVVDLPAKVQIPGLAYERTGIEIAKDVAVGML